MEENIIQKYIFPRRKDTIFRSCDFHLVNEKVNKNVSSSSIPITLRETDENKSDPYLILFYFNKHKDILREWENLGSNFPLTEIDISISLLNPIQKLKKINFKAINLEYEKDLYNTFRNLQISNPFYWSKILRDNKNHFTIFYLNTFPVEFYSSIIDQRAIEERYYKDSLENYYARYINHRNNLGFNYIEEKKKVKFKSFDSLRLKGRYFKALEDDRPFPGVKKGKIYKVVEKTPGDFFVEELN
tara:strand:- start:10303 stop:11034 length:732 start_codon:yes stop_codon:yes gene_type:complete